MSAEVSGAQFLTVLCSDVFAVAELTVLHRGNRILTMLFGN